MRTSRLRSPCLLVEIDPDADGVDAKATANHLAKLITTANEWAERLCGQISIFHIRRGDGAKQAFHDRYLSVVDQQGVPTVYLLSNSLSKAAGDWPFAICQLDRVMSWRVHDYILSVIEGRYGNLDLHPAVIWKSAEPPTPGLRVSQDENAIPPSDTRAEWVESGQPFPKRPLERCNPQL